MTDEPEGYEILLHRTELIPGGNGARIGFSDDIPGKQFLISPAVGGVLGVREGESDE